MKEYITHDNGSRPFKVIIDELDQCKVYTQPDTECDSEYTNLVWSGNVQKVFIGKSPKIEMTKFSKGYGPEFDGNSILVQLRSCSSEYKYVFIGDKIFEFTTDSIITNFVSPVGNNDVPYPYAVDHNGRYYLMIENITYIPTETASPDPYRYFYNKLSRIELKDFGYNEAEWYVDTESYGDKLGWQTDPDKHYVWMLNTCHENPGNFVPPSWDPEPKMWIKSQGQIQEITKDQYVCIHQEHAVRRGLSAFCNNHVLHSRT